MSKIKQFFNVFLFMLLSITAFGQRFGFGATAGLTFSQVNGDRLAGYDKLGIEAGLRTNILLTDRWDLIVELLYSQRGSASEITFGGDNAGYALQLNYLAIPVMAELKDWEVKDDDNEKFHRIRLAGGIVYGRLFEATETFETNIDYGDQDLSMVIEGGYHITRHVAIALRYTRTVIPLDEVVIAGEPANVIPHHVTLGGRYIF